MATQARSSLASYALAAAVTIAAIAATVIAHEFSRSFFDALTRLARHHWRTESFLAIALFAILSAALGALMRLPRVRALLRADDPWLWAVVTVVTTAVAALGIAAAVIIHYVTRP